MRRILLITAMLIAASTMALGNPASFQDRAATNDEEALKQLVKDWADAAVHADLANLEKFADSNFRGSAEGISFNKPMLLAALRSGRMKVRTGR